MLHGTHPRADLCLISCPGNHPPVSYLSASKRSMHVHHVPFPQREEEEEDEDEVFAPDHATMTEALQSVLSKSEGYVLNKDLPDKDQQRGMMEKSLDLENLTVAPSLILDGNGKRDSGYGDSTSTSREALHSTKSSSSLLSRLKPLLHLGKKKQPPVIDESNPFNRIFEERPLSELRKSLDSLIAERGRSSLPGINTLPPPTTVHKSPECKSPEYHPGDEMVMEELDSLFGSLSSSQQVSPPEVAIGDAVSEDDGEFRISPLPHDSCFDDTALPIPSICRQNSLEFNLCEGKKQFLVAP